MNANEDQLLCKQHFTELCIDCAARAFKKVLTTKDVMVYNEINQQTQFNNKPQIFKTKQEQMITTINNNNENFKIMNQEIIDKQQDFESFTYQLMEKYSIQQKKKCYSITINKECKIVAAGFDKQIKIYEFNKGLMKLKQLLGKHKDTVTTLNFMKESNKLISGLGLGFGFGPQLAPNLAQHYYASNMVGAMGKS